MNTRFNDFINIELFRAGNYALNVGQMLMVVVIFFATKLILLILRKYLKRNNLFKSLDKGQATAYYQISKYIISVIAIALSLETLGVKITFLLAGSAALLVGIGLGLQQLFNDLVSGFIILTERTITIEDIIEVEGIVAQVKHIGLRTSEVEDRNGIFMIIPNSKIVNENVINWSHNNLKTRFSLEVSVAYGSDVDLVANLLKQAANENKNIDQKNECLARFTDFGDSGLMFQLLFWSEENFRIEEIKSQLRFAINKKFLKNNIQIPFPQRDLHLKSSIPLSFEKK